MVVAAAASLVGRKERIWWRSASGRSLILSLRIKSRSRPDIMVDRGWGSEERITIPIDILARHTRSRSEVKNFGVLSSVYISLRFHVY